MMPKLVLRLLESLIWDLLLIKEFLLGLGHVFPLSDKTSSKWNYFCGHSLEASQWDTLNEHQVFFFCGEMNYIQASR